ncbi:developmentally-regulated protein [Acrasis kona]|uniref:Developmentally-regulated protein n=1 Tax=Acrasis kona TaxID=1008807 RepID=A0AAW2Z1R3_9EUKA
MNADYVGDDFLNLQDEFDSYFNDFNNCTPQINEVKEEFAYGSVTQDVELKDYFTSELQNEEVQFNQNPLEPPQYFGQHHNQITHLDYGNPPPQLTIDNPTLPQTSMIMQQREVPKVNPTNVYICDNVSQLDILRNMGVPFILVNMPTSDTLSSCRSVPTPIDDMMSLNINGGSPNPDSLQRRNSCVSNPGVNSEDCSIMDRLYQRRGSVQQAVNNNVVEKMEVLSQDQFQMLEQIKRLPAYDEPLSYFCTSPETEKQTMFKPIPAMLSKIKKKTPRMVRSENNTPITPETPIEGSHKYLVSQGRIKSRRNKKDRAAQPEQKFMMKFSLKD